ncbi:MAG: protein translocase subunit SecF, partial [Dehalococcoidales bacterium]|nr:protein translocase subunit SecF [Dehalococcoidales bacterium]
MFNIINKRFSFFLISIVVLIICLVVLGVSGLNIGMDFSGGSRLTLSFEQEVTIEELETELVNLGFENAVVQVTSSGDYIIRTEKLSADGKTQLKEDLTSAFGAFTETAFTDISPETALGTARISVIAVIAAAVGILMYITWAFRIMPKPFRYGTCAIVALLHDTLITLGIFTMVGFAMNLEINLMFITGILAVLGYSVNNTVVVFDRIRENLRTNPSASFETIVNTSITQTFARSMNSSLTTIITVLALILFIGTNIQSFALALIIGIVVGTFDSLFVA